MAGNGWTEGERYAWQVSADRGIDAPSVDLVARILDGLELSDPPAMAELKVLQERVRSRVLPRMQVEAVYIGRFDYVVVVVRDYAIGKQWSLGIAHRPPAPITVTVTV